MAGKKNPNLGDKLRQEREGAENTLRDSRSKTADSSTGDGGKKKAEHRRQIRHEADLAKMRSKKLKSDQEVKAKKNAAASGKKGGKPKKPGNLAADALSAKAHQSVRNADQDNNSGVEAAHFTEGSAEGAARAGSRFQYGRKLRQYKKLERLEKKGNKDAVDSIFAERMKSDPQAGSNLFSRWRQKQAIKKEYAAAKAGAAAAENTASGTAKAAQGTVSITEKAFQFVQSHSHIIIGIAAVGLLVLVIAGSVSSCSVLINGGGNLGARAFEEIGGEVVQTTAFVRCANHVEGYKGTYCRLIEPTSQQGKADMFISGQNQYRVGQISFSKIPGVPVAYWISPEVLKLFDERTVGSIADAKSGMTTTDNTRFLRLWEEVNCQKIGFGYGNIADTQDMKYKWFPFCKGGDFRRWAGNESFVVNWFNNGEEIRIAAEGATGGRLVNIDCALRECLVWTKISSANISLRMKKQGIFFSDAAPGVFANRETLYYLLALLNTKYANEIIKLINPTLNFVPGAVSSVPVKKDEKNKGKIIEIAEGNVQLSEQDWDSFETSWDFKKHPLLQNVSTISEAFNQWQAECDDRFNQLKTNEEELNRIFIDIYGLQDELTPEVEDKDVTVRKADLQRDIKSLLSYAVGCMFGRYSTYKDGLLFAGEPYSLQAFVDKMNERPGTISAEELERAYRNEGIVVDEMFFPDADNVIPITDEEYLDDDIVSRLCAWLKAVYGADTLEANLDYIAKALGNKGSTSREIIRNYFLNDFFKDHCQTYSVTGSGKRPIYWLFDSGKQNGFKALVYLHRYTPDTIGNLRIDYLHKMQRVYESEINRMQDMMDHSGNAREVAAASKRKDKLAKQLKECREYDEKISHLALSRIELDLDDGVKVNYRKLQTAQDGKFYEVLADSKNIMVKEKK